MVLRCSPPQAAESTRSTKSDKNRPVGLSLQLYAAKEIPAEGIVTPCIEWARSRMLANEELVRGKDSSGWRARSTGHHCKGRNGAMECPCAIRSRFKLLATHTRFQNCKRLSALERAVRILMQLRHASPTGNV